MVDGGFRENTFGAKYFSHQDFPRDQYEVIWVDYYDKISPNVASNPKIKAIALNKKGIYHSSYCFNEGINKAKGEIIIIPDADQIVMPDFLSRVWDSHKNYEKLVVYGYRYDEVKEGVLNSLDFKEIENKCILKNPLNYGGCLTVRKKWLLEMNGYEQHGVFRTGFHANGLLMYSRFKNMGIAVQWDQSLRLYHPWHPFTLSGSCEYSAQQKVIEWIQSNMYWKAIEGIDPTKNTQPPDDLKDILNEQINILNTAITNKLNISVIDEFPKNVTQPLLYLDDRVKNPSFLNRLTRKIFGHLK